VILSCFILSFFLFVSCGQPSLGFPVTDETGERIAYSLSPRPPKGEEGKFLNAREGHETPRYIFKRGLSVNSEGKSFFLIYEATESCLLTIETDEGVTEHEIPQTYANTEVRLPVAKGRAIKSFQVTSTRPECELSILRAGIADSFSGVRFGDSPLIGGGISLYVSKGTTYIREFSLPQAVPGDTAVEITYGGAGRLNGATATLILYGGGERSVFTLDLLQKSREGGEKVMLYPAMCRFPFNEIRIESDAPGFYLSSLILTPMDADDTLRPLPGDLGNILLYDSRHWRNPSFELFSWDRFPGILVMDTLNYDIQSRFFKRIAFFVEKRGFQGRILDDKTIGPLHGWNAHDYRALDLAAFFDKAFKENFPLYEEERLLFKVLKANGVLKEGKEGIEPGLGGILSISQETDASLRRVFLVHEGYHGVFFSSTAYADEVAKIWDGLAPEEKDFWSRFLASKQYNVADGYLLVNEFQAYLMQQSPGLADSYFKKYIIPQMIKNDGKLEPILSGLTGRYPDTFLRNAQAVEDAAERTTGVIAGDLIGIRRAE
jgi:hypothetical protein